MTHTVLTDWHLWLSFLGLSVAICCSPGAGAVQSMATGAAYGLVRGYWSILGLELGLLAQLSLIAAGVGAVVAESVLVFNAIKWVGVAYLIYLAVRQWGATGYEQRPKRQQDGQRDGRLSLVARGFLVNATNPKALVFMLAVMPQFLLPTASLLPQYGILGLTFITVDVVVMSIYTGLSARFLRWLRTPRQQTILNRILSALFAVAAVALSAVRAVAA